LLIEKFSQPFSKGPGAIERSMFAQTSLQFILLYVELVKDQLGTAQQEDFDAVVIIERAEENLFRTAGFLWRRATYRTTQPVYIANWSGRQDLNL
jgi:hypothetical protein